MSSELMTGPSSLTPWGPCLYFPCLGLGQVQPDLQEPLASIEPLQDGPVQHGGGPAGELRELLLHVGGAPQGGVMHEKGHAVQAAGRWGPHVTVRPGSLTCPPVIPLLTHVGSFLPTSTTPMTPRQAFASLWTSGSLSAQGGQGTDS